jgi:hypothetical protein
MITFSVGGLNVQKHPKCNIIRQVRIQDFKLGGALKKKNCWGVSCEKSRFYAKKSYFFQF